MRGILFEDGAIARFGKKEAQNLVDFIKPGTVLALRGEEIVATAGTVIEATEIGSSLGNLNQVKPKKPKRHHDEAMA